MPENRGAKCINVIASRDNSREEREVIEEADKTVDSVENMIRVELLNKKDGSVGQATNCEHEISLKPGTAPVKYRIRLVPVQLRYEFKVCNDSSLARSIIRTSKSAWAASIMLVRRLGGSIRVCVNYSYLINATVKDAYPMPNIDYLIYRLHQLEIATIFDLIVGFNRVEKSKTHKPFSEFVKDWGLFESNFMNVGLTNASAKLQNMIKEVLVEEKDKRCLVYSDNVLIFTSSREANFRDVKVFCFRLSAVGLRLKWENCRDEHMLYEPHNVPSKLRQVRMPNTFASTCKQNWSRNKLSSTQRLTSSLRKRFVIVKKQDWLLLFRIGKHDRKAIMGGAQRRTVVTRKRLTCSGSMHFHRGGDVCNSDVIDATFDSRSRSRTQQETRETSTSIHVEIKIKIEIKLEK